MVAVSRSLALMRTKFISSSLTRSVTSKLPAPSNGEIRPDNLYPRRFFLFSVRQPSRSRRPKIRTVVPVSPFAGTRCHLIGTSSNKVPLRISDHWKVTNQPSSVAECRVSTERHPSFIVPSRPSPLSPKGNRPCLRVRVPSDFCSRFGDKLIKSQPRSEEHTSELQSLRHL